MHKSLYPRLVREDGQCSRLHQHGTTQKANSQPVMCRPEQKEIRAESSSIYFQLIKPRSGLIGKSSVTQKRSISDREIWPGRRDAIPGGLWSCFAKKRQKGKLKQMYEVNGCRILHILVQSCSTALMDLLIEEENRNTVFDAPGKKLKPQKTLICEMINECQMFWVSSVLFIMLWSLFWLHFVQNLTFEKTKIMEAIFNHVSLFSKIN